MLKPEIFKTAILLLVSGFWLLVSGCGWQPLYGENEAASGAAGVSKKLAQVDIANIPDREGQYLRNRLIDRFYRESRPADPSYALTVTPVNEQLIDLDITKAANATRAQMRLATTMVLKDLDTGEILLSRTLRAITSYNILGSEFATRVSENNARENALNDLARQIELQLSLYFKRQAAYSE